MRTFLIAVIILFVTLPLQAGKKRVVRVSEKEARSVVLEVYPDASIDRAVLEKQGRKKVWHLTITDGGTRRNVLVDTKTGEVLTPKETTPGIRSDGGDKEDRQESGIGQDKAAAIASKKVPGTILSNEVSERNGFPVYTIRIKTSKGKIVAVDVDGTRGRISRIQTEN